MKRVRAKDSVVKYDRDKFVTVQAMKAYGGVEVKPRPF